MKSRRDLLDERSPAGLEVFQLTTEPAVPASHLYMEAQIFTPDSKRFVLHRSATPHGGAQKDPEHRYLLCDLENGGKLSPLTDEIGVTGPSVSPDGRWLYYFHDQTAINAGRLTLKRVRLDGSGRETIVVLDRPAPGTARQISQMYPLSSISSDGQRIAICGFLGDGRRDPPPWGLLVFDIPGATAELILEGPSWCNIHPQYCRSTDPEAARDILVQENHGNACSPVDGDNRILVSGPGADIHVIRDDGTQFRNLPWGRDGHEFCQGHQCWRGRSTVAITSTEWAGTPPEHGLVEGAIAPYAGHLGAQTPGARRNVLSQAFPHPHFYHFATDIDGRRFITDYAPDPAATSQLCAAEFGAELAEPLRNWRYLLDTKSQWTGDAHTHPFLSPDGKLGFFNSNESGILQAYMVRGL